MPLEPSRIWFGARYKNIVYLDSLAMAGDICVSDAQTDNATGGSVEVVHNIGFPTATVSCESCFLVAVRAAS